MAAGLFRRMLEKAGRNDVEVDSAGVDAVNGQWASGEAMEVMLRNGVNITAHKSKAVDAELVASSDIIVCMEDRHRSAILARWPDASGKTRLLLELSGKEGDLKDPIGGAYSGYVACLDLIRPALECLMGRIGQIDVQ